MPGTAREIDEGEYATLRTETNASLLNFNLIANRLSLHHSDGADDNTSEEGKLLDCVRDDSVTYASTRDLEPPMPPPPPPPPLDDECHMYRESSTETLVNPVSVTVHTSDGSVSIPAITPKVDAETIENLTQPKKKHQKHQKNVKNMKTSEK